MALPKTECLNPKFTKLLSSKYFIYIVATFFLLIWMLRVELIGISLSVAFVCFVLISQKDLTPILPIATLFITGISLTQMPPEIMPDVYPIIDFGHSDISITLTQGYIFIGVLAAILIGSVIFHLVRFKNEKSEDTQPFYKPFLAAFIAMVFGGVLFSSSRYTPLSMVVSGLYIVLFVFFAVCRLANPIGNQKEYFASLCIAYAAVGCVQMLIFYIRQDNLIDALIYKHLFLGWAYGNTLAPIIALAIPMSLYLYIKKQQVVYFALALVFYTGVLFSVCRGEIFLTTLAAPILAVFICIWSKKKLEPIITVTVFIVIVVLVYFMFKDFFSEFFDRISYFSNSGRTPLRIEFSKYFAQNPIFGVGYLVFYGEKMLLAMPHMIVTNILSTIGIVGFFAFVYFYYSIFKAVFSRKSKYNIFVAFSLGLVACYAFAAPTFYEVMVHFPLFVALQGSRRDSKAERYKLWDKIDKLVDASALSAIIAFLGALLIASLLFSVVAFTGYEKFIFKKETFSYFMSAGLFVGSCITLPYTTGKIYTLIKNKYSKQKT